MNIAILGTRYSPPFFRGGEERIIHELKKKFIERGHSITVFTPGFKKWQNIDKMSTAKNVIRFPIHNIRFIYNLEFSYKLKKFLRDNHYDIILNTHTHLGFFHSSIPQILNAQVTAYGESRSIKSTSFSKFLEKIIRLTFGIWTDKKVFSNCKHIICVNDHIRDDIISNYYIPARKLDIIGNGVNCEYFQPATSIKNKNRILTITYAGRLVNRKNVELLIRAASILSEKSKIFKIKIIGEGEDRDKLMTLTKDLKLENNIDFLGRKTGDELLDLYQKSDIFVLPSRYEGLPLVLLESQACGIPAVVTNFHGADNIIKHGENGFILKDWQPETLAKFLRLLLHDNNLRNKMSKNARRIMVDFFSWDIVSEKFLKILSTVKKESS